MFHVPKTRLAAPKFFRSSLFFETYLRSFQTFLYYWFILRLSNLIQSVFEQHFKKETYPNQFRDSYAQGLDDTRNQCFEQEVIPLIALYTHPSAVAYKQHYIRCYQAEIDAMNKELRSWSARFLSYLNPRSLHSHKLRYFQQAIARKQKLKNYLENTPTSIEKEKKLSSNIDWYYYVEHERNSKLSEIQFMNADKRDLRTASLPHIAARLSHPEQQKWLSRMIEFSFAASWPTGHINLLMWFDPIQFGFVYHSRHRNIDLRILQAAAAKYVRTFFCVEFFIDDKVFPFMRESSNECIRQYFLDKESKLKKKKQVVVNGVTTWVDADPTLLVTEAGEGGAGGGDAAASAPSTELIEVVDENPRASWYEKVKENPHSVAKNNARIRLLQKTNPTRDTDVRVRFIYSEDPKVVDKYQMRVNLPSSFTNEQFELYCLMEHGLDKPEEMRHELIMSMHSDLLTFDNSLALVAAAYENVSEDKILETGMQRIEMAKQEAAEYCEKNGYYKEDAGKFIRKLRIDDKAKLNQENVQYLLLQQEVQTELVRGTLPLALLNGETLLAILDKDSKLKVFNSIKGFKYFFIDRFFIAMFNFKLMAFFTDI